MENTAFNYILWADVIAGLAVMGYGYFMWAQIRGWLNPSARMLLCIRILFVFAILMPVAVRFHYSEHTILLISSIIVLIGFVIRIRNKWGI